MSDELLEVIEAARALVAHAVAVPDLSIVGYPHIELVLVADADVRRLADALVQLLKEAAP